MSVANSVRRSSRERPRVPADPVASEKRPRDHAHLALATDLHTLSRITQIWSDRLQLISVYASFFTSIDSVLFSLASTKDNRTTTSRVMLASLVGGLVFHAGAAILAYVASFVLIRYRLNGEQSTTSPSESPITTLYSKYASPGSKSTHQQRTPSALESGNPGSHRRAEHTHHSQSSHSFTSSPFTPFFVGWPPLFSTLTTTLTSFLEEPPLLKIDLRRVSLFNLATFMPCVARPVHDGDPKADAEKNARALVRLLNKCHSVCSMFAVAGFICVVTGIVSYVWTVLERPVAIFGSACVGFCVIFGFAALH